ncbi:hypothetical protein NCS52_00632500 [Fusarium sp. LHS14.1]|nr:hypothetical protein NCS52_00632500 [Fusarium sp. LHS14.1]
MSLFQAPDPKPPGRKRGRPPNASKPTTSASQDRPDEYEADVEEAARPKQRLRPKKSADTVEQSPPQEEAPKRKRGRPSLDSKDGDATAEAQPRRKRGRPSLEKQQDEEEVVEDAPKPKRGRRPKPSEEQQEEQPDEDEAVENAEKPRRRRRAKPTEEEQQNEEEVVENAGKKKRGKRAKPTEEEQQQHEDEATEGTKKQKRKARSKVTEDEQPEEEEKQQPRKRGRKAARQQEPELEEAEPAPKKRRRREAPAEEEPEEEQTVRQSPRNSLRDLGPESVHNKGAEGTKSKKKKGRAPDTREEEEENQQDEAQPKKRGRRKGSRPSTENAEAAKEQEQQNNTSKRRRTSKEAASSSDEELPSPPKPYPHIAPYTRTIKSSTIAAKWTPLTGASLPAASSILTLAHQPILQRTSSTRNRRTHASAALHLVSRRIERKLARGLPFPPASSSGGARMGRRRGADADGGRALELDFEAVLDGKTALERQLVPAKHAVELLRAEKARMEQELEDDYEKLRKLEADARAQTRERKDLYRKAHVLAPTSQPLPKDPDNTITTDDRDSSSNLKVSSFLFYSHEITHTKSNTKQHLVDTPLEPLALQLAGHVESIRGNLQQADGVAPQLARTKAALQDVLHRYLDSGAYEQVLLG